MQRLATREVAVLHQPAREGEVKHSVAHTEAAAKLLDFRAQIQLSAGLGTMIGIQGRQ